MSTWNIQLISDWDRIWEAQHLQRWQAHMDTAEQSHVFFHPALIRAWVETYLPLRSLRPLFLWARSTDGNTAMLPLVLWRRNWKNAWLKMIIPMGYSDFDYHDPIFHHKPGSDAAAAFWSSVEKALKEIDHDQIVLDGLHAASAPSHWLKKGEEPCPFIDLLGMKTLDDYLDTLSSKLRGELRRLMKKLDTSGSFHLQEFEHQDIESAQESLKTMLVHHRKRWPGAYKAPHFHEKIVTYGLQAGIVHFTQTTFDHQPMSWILSFIYRGNYYYWMPAMNQELSKLSPGKVNLILCIDAALNKGLTKYDHLRGGELYKSRFTNSCDYVSTSITTNTTLRCKLKQALLALRHK